VANPREQDTVAPSRRASPTAHAEAAALLVASRLDGNLFPWCLAISANRVGVAGGKGSGLLISCALPQPGRLAFVTRAETSFSAYPIARSRVTPFSSGTAALRKGTMKAKSGL